jgi:hypothetical protein
MGRTRDVSKILTSNTSILTLASASSVYQTIAKTGLVEITPSTVSVSGGSGSVSTTGVVSFTSASAISLNNVFSSTYDHYKVMIKMTNSLDTEGYRIRLRLSGTDASGSNYSFLCVRQASSTVSAQPGTDLSACLVGFGHSTAAANFMEIFNPALSQQTQIFSTSFVPLVYNSYAGRHSLSTAYDGFSIIMDAGTMTGTINVYGYNK